MMYFETKTQKDLPHMKFSKQNMLITILSIFLKIIMSIFKGFKYLINSKQTIASTLTLKL